MNYELAKQLKEKGFSHLICEWTDELPDRQSNEVLPNPTLSELIEACGKEFRMLVLHGIKPTREGHIGKYGEGYKWQAKPNRQLVKAPRDFSTKWGQTPEEAVARLWLALNEK